MKLVCHNWFVTRNEFYLFVLYRACGGIIFIKISNFRKKNFHFILFHFIFLCYYCCSINLKKHSEHSGLRPDTSSVVSFYILWTMDICCVDFRWEWNQLDFYMLRKTWFSTVNLSTPPPKWINFAIQMLSWNLKRVKQTIKHQLRAISSCSIRKPSDKFAIYCCFLIEQLQSARERYLIFCFSRFHVFNFDSKFKLPNLSI